MVKIVEHVDFQRRIEKHLRKFYRFGYISPIYKGKREENDPDNYRGITVLSCFGKLFTSVINDRIHSFFRNQ